MNENEREIIAREIGGQLEVIAHFLPCGRCGVRGVAFLQMTGIDNGIGGYCAACMVTVTITVACESGILPPVEVLAGIMEGFTALAEDAENEGGIAVELSTVKRFQERHAEDNGGSNGATMSTRSVKDVRDARGFNMAQGYL